METIDVRKALRTIGNSTFIKYFNQFKNSFHDTYEKHLNIFYKEKWKESSKKIKFNTAKKIFLAAQEKVALEVILSARNDEITTNRATEIFITLYPTETPRSILFIRPEFIFDSNIITKLFSGYTIHRQYPVEKYKVDWYIEELNIVIELDENHHLKNTEEDKIRQMHIENILKCKFLRYKL